MGWDKRGYYYRAQKVNGRVVREYVGSGRLAELAAELDQIERQQRMLEHADMKIERDNLDAIDATLEELNNVANLLARAALLAAGFHQHKRGEWRKQRVRNEIRDGEART